MRNSCFLFFVGLIIIFSGCHRSVYFKEIKRKNLKLQGQTAPNDMVFIPGNDKTPSFYLSVIEEPNINYVMYLKWLIHVYIDYPQPFLAALPKNPGDSIINNINDPYLKYYLTNPAFAYYPVVNLTWQQIQNYLVWKTDRLNEVILLKAKVFPFLREQINEDNFNTESYLLGQYEGSWRKKKEELIDNALFTGFRLPTEAEWDYASQFQVQNTKTKRRFNNRIPFHPFGNDYYPLLWGKYYNRIDKDYYYSNDFYKNRIKKIALMNYQIDPSKNERSNYKFEGKNYDLDALFITILDYPVKSYGPINMDAGVKEWMLDEYHDTVDLTNNWLEIMQAGGFNISNAAVTSPKTGKYIEKDSLGRMKHFRFIGIDSTGQLQKISLFTDGESRKRVVKGGTWKDPGNFRYPLDENHSSHDIGFRCVLPYTGGHILKKYRVKWGKKINYSLKD